MLNTMYNLSIGSIQMTLLPLLLTGPHLNLDSSNIALVFTIISVTQFLLARPVAYLSDNYDKIILCGAGCLLISSSAVLIPYSAVYMDFQHVLVSLVPLSVGCSIMSAVPIPYTVNVCFPNEKTQGSSLLRVCGDVGMLMGAFSSGYIASMSSIEHTMIANGGLLATSLLYIEYLKWEERKTK